MATEAYPSTSAGRTARAAPPWRDDLRMLLGVAAIIVAILGVGNNIGARIDSLERQFDARFSSLERRFDTRFSGLEARMTGLQGRMDGAEAALRELNSRVGRIEGRLGLPAAEK